MPDRSFFHFSPFIKLRPVRQDRGGSLYIMENEKGRKYGEWINELTCLTGLLFIFSSKKIGTGKQKLSQKGLDRQENLAGLPVPFHFSPFIKLRLVRQNMEVNACSPKKRKEEKTHLTSLFLFPLKNRNWQAKNEPKKLDIGREKPMLASPISSSLLFVLLI